MNRVFLTAALLAASPVLFAQDDRAAAEPAMPPNPKHEQHETLKALAGTWEVLSRTDAMPGVPGMEEPTESKGTEHAELVCDGLWLKSVLRSTWNGEPFEGVFLVGYDPFQEQFVGLWVSSHDDGSGATEWQGSYDAESKTWTWNGTSPQGEVRSTVQFTDPDHTIETCYLTGEDGVETKCAVIERIRKKRAAPMEASTKPTAELTNEQEVLLEDVGTWDAVVEVAMEPGAPPSKEKATERVTAMCDGRWLWTDFAGQFGGMPFTGHALYGYDPAAGKFVSYWIDSMSPMWMRTTGELDPASATLTCTGEGIGADGKPMKVTETVTKKGRDERVLDMAFQGAEQSSTMRITLHRTKD